MLRRYRRYWALLIWAVLAAPLAAMLFAPPPATVEWRERRAPATWPEWPEGRGAWQRLPRRIDTYLADHFGMRGHLLRAEALLKQRLLQNGNGKVLIGLDGWLFYRAFTVLQQGAGVLVRQERVEETADTLARVAQRLAARGTRLLVAPPPGANTIYDAKLPPWARNQGRPTEYDALLTALKARGIPAVDLRPGLRAAAVREQIYFQRDTHWNNRGALEAFNLVAEAAGHPDWRLEPAATLGASAPYEGGLTWMLGVDDAGEPGPMWLTSRTDRQAPDNGDRTPFTLTGNHPGPSLLIVGDSFTRSFFPPLALTHVGRLDWLHHQGCRFDWSLVEAAGVEEVWWMPTERNLLCHAGASPKGFDAGESGPPPAVEMSTAE
jgi:hypothetical protein